MYYCVKEGKRRLNVSRFVNKPIHKIVNVIDVRLFIFKNYYTDYYTVTK